MIITSIQQLSRYEGISSKMKRAIAFLQSTDISTIPEGKTAIDGDDIFVIRSKTEMMPAQQVKLEAHNAYIDLQVPLHQAETFGWADRQTLQTPVSAFDTERDIIFFEDSIPTLVNVHPMECIIFFPEDAHAPCIGKGLTDKVIVKVAVG